jgi:hypothetical protein
MFILFIFCVLGLLKQWIDSRLPQDQPTYRTDRESRPYTQPTDGQIAAHLDDERRLRMNLARNAM